jgi:PleD family two-component response regulator
LIEDQEWTARSIESIFRPANFAVLKTYTGRQGLEVAERLSPDLVLVDRHLPDMGGGDVIRQLHEAGSIGPTTPVAIITSGAVSQTEKLDLFRAGAWDVFTSPVDPEELSVRAQTWVRAKKEADRAREASLVDQLTGSYNFDGLSRRVREITAESRRYERPMACIVLGAPLEDRDSVSGIRVSNGIDQKVVDALHQVCRVSDAVGRVRNQEFIVVAPSTDDSGAEVLAKRILTALDESLAEVNLRAGVYSLKRSPREPLDLTDLLGPATAALRKAQTSPERLSVHTSQMN